MSGKASRRNAAENRTPTSRGAGGAPPKNAPPHPDRDSPDYWALVGAAHEWTRTTEADGAMSRALALAANLVLVYKGARSDLRVGFSAGQPEPPEFDGLDRLILGGGGAHQSQARYARPGRLGSSEKRARASGAVERGDRSGECLRWVADAGAFQVELWRERVPANAHREHLGRALAQIAVMEAALAPYFTKVQAVLGS